MDRATLPPRRIGQQVESTIQQGAKSTPAIDSMTAERDSRRASTSTAGINETTPLLVSADNSLPVLTADTQTLPNGNQIEDAQSVSSTNEQGPPGHASPTQVVLVLIVGVFIAQLDGSFVLATHSNIASEFGQLERSNWLITSFALAMCAVQPCYGKISDVFGRKESLIAAYAILTIGSFICGIGNSLELVVFGRAITGVGGAGCNALISLIILDLVPLRQVASLRSYVNIAATTGRSLGGPIGGALADTIGWRWSFIIQCPLLTIAAILVYFWVPSNPDDEHTETISGKLSRIDFAGAVFLAVAITSLLLSIEFKVQELPWTHPLVLGLILTSVFFGSLFYITETYWAVEPIFPLTLFGQRDVISAFMVMGFQTAAQMSMMFSVPVYFQVTQSVSSSVAGAHLFPAVAGNAIGALISGLIIKRTGRSKLLAIFATFSACVCYALLIWRWKGNTNLWESLYIIPGGFGTGMAEASVFISLSAAVEKSLQAIALAGLFLAGTIGLLIGLTLSSAVFEIQLTTELSKQLSDIDNKEEIARKAVSDISYVLKLKGRLRELVNASYVRALEYDHGLSLLFSAAALFFAIIVRQSTVSR